MTMDGVSRFKKRKTILTLILALMACAMCLQACVLFLFLPRSSEEEKEATPIQTRAFQSADRIRIVVSEKYDDSTSIRLPFEEYARKILRYAIMTNGKPRFVSKNVHTPELTIEIKAEGELLSSTYRREGKVFDWHKLATGVLIMGDINFKMDSIDTYSRHFSFKKDPVTKVSAEIEKYTGYHALWSAEYKFKYAFDHSSFLRTIVLMMCEIYGDDVVVDAALHDRDKDFVESTLSIMASCGTRFVPKMNEIVEQTNSDESRHMALRVMSMTRDTSVLPIISRWSLNKSYKYRGDVIRSLAKIRDPRILAPVVESLQEAINEENCALIKDCTYVLSEAQDKYFGWLNIEVRQPLAIDLLIKSIDICYSSSKYNIDQNLIDILYGTTGVNYWYDTTKWNKWFHDHRKSVK